MPNIILTKYVSDKDYAIYLENKELIRKEIKAVVDKRIKKA